MSLRIHQIVTAEAEAPLATSLLNEGVGGHPGSEPLVPYGFRPDIVRSDGSVVPGTMGPMPAWLIEGSDRVILVDTGVGDIDEIGRSSARTARTGRSRAPRTKVSSWACGGTA